MQREKQKIIVHTRMNERCGQTPYCEVMFLCNFGKLLSHLCQQTSSSCHVLKVLTKIECNTIDDNQLHLPSYFEISDSVICMPERTKHFLSAVMNLMSIAQKVLSRTSPPLFACQKESAIFGCMCIPDCVPSEGLASY